MQARMFNHRINIEQRGISYVQTVFGYGFAVRARVSKFNSGKSMWVQAPGYINPIHVNVPVMDNCLVGSLSCKLCIPPS